MPAPRVCVLRAPGTNCDVETAHAFDRAGAESERVHVNRLLEEPSLLEGFQVLCIPGGFSYGDDVGAGVLFGGRLARDLSDELAAFLGRDTLTLGICNGFQVLLKAGVLPYAAAGFPPQGERPLTLTWNTSGRYDTRWVSLRTGSANSPFLRGIETLEVPMAHAEGRIVLGEGVTLDTLHRGGHVALCYRGPGDARPFVPSEAVLDPPDNPNGSAGNIAGLCSADGRVLGLMPHPERFIDATQHPQWTRRKMTGEGDGMAMFRNAVSYFA